IGPGPLPLFCGCGLSGEGLVVERLELYRGEHPERAVEAPVVVPVDPAGGRELDVCERPEGTGVEDGGADALGLVQAVRALHERVVIGVADGPDRRGDAFEVEVFGVSDRGVRGTDTRSGVSWG